WWVLSQRALSVLALLLAWEIASLLIGSRRLPSPARVAAILGSEIANGAIPYHTAITLGRVAASFIVSMAIGTAIGIAMGRVRALDQFFDGWLVVFLNIPALVTIVLCYIWFGFSEIAAVAAVAINKIPTVAVTMREGARALDR